MTVSIWRYSHLILALTSALFLILASVTGIILVFEPIENAVKPYKTVDLSTVTLSETIEVLGTTYDEVLSLEVDENDFLIASVVTKAGESETIYADPKTGKKLGEPEHQAPFFQFATNLHRSLFLKSIGRFFVGLVSFLLCLIAVTGLLLIIKRQGGLSKLFSKVQNDYFELRYHVIVGRLFLLPIIIIGATGVYLSLEKFSLLPDTVLQHKIIAPEADVDFDSVPAELEVFKNITLDQVRSINFPFSEMSEDYFEISLQDKEIHVHQYTGAILSQAYYPFVTLASRWSLSLHTGQGSIIWSLILLSASLSILFFIYSGLVMWRKRTKNTMSTLLLASKDEASHVILVGSETGNTFDYAQLLASALNKVGKSVFMAELNHFSTYPKAQQLIILTSTYGNGEAPTNARKFRKLLENFNAPDTMSYSVVGFGSLLYPAFCAFALEIDQLLQKTNGFEKILPIHKINGQDDHAFENWVNDWGEKTETPIEIKAPKTKKRALKTGPFTVVQRSDINQDNTFLVRLRPKGKIDFQSGDLVGVIAQDGIERQYSIAKIQNDIVLSVKKHEFGICSSYLSRLEVGKKLHLSIKKNEGFHFPNNGKPVLLIANGTGVAPFIGMLHENYKKVETHLFLGLRNRKSLGLYEPLLSATGKYKKWFSLKIAYSRGNKNQYVQELVRENKNLVADTLKNGGSIFICGSLVMQRSVTDELETIVAEKLNTSLGEFENRQQLKIDCY